MKSRPSGTHPKTTKIYHLALDNLIGFAAQQLQPGLSNKVMEALGGWGSPHMASHYAASLVFDDAL